MGEAEGKEPDVVSTHAFTVSCASEKGAPCVPNAISADWVCLPQCQGEEKIATAISISGFGCRREFQEERNKLFNR